MSLLLCFVAASFVTELNLKEIEKRVAFLIHYAFDAACVKLLVATV